MRILVTGGAGFIGSHIVERLMERGDQVLVVDDMSAGKHDNLPREARLEEMDIGDPALLDVASSFRPHVVAHLAAQLSVTVSMDDPVLDATTNVLGGINVCQAAIGLECAQFIYISTGGALYGQPESLPCDEDHPKRPISPYGLSKWTLECYLKMLLPASMPLKVLRLSNVYGPRQDPNGEAGVVAIFGLPMLRGAPVTIYGDGEQTRDFVYVRDVAVAYELAQQKPEPVTVNVGSGQATSVNELFRLMAAETGYDPQPVYEAERPGEIKHVVLSNARAKGLLGWTPDTPMRQGLRETLAWMGTQA